MIDFLKPYVIETANEALNSHNHHSEKSVPVNKIVYNYPISNIIRENYYSKYDKIIYSFMNSVILDVEKEIKQHLNKCGFVNIRTNRLDGVFRADHRINISISI